MLATVAPAQVKRGLDRMVGTGATPFLRATLFGGRVECDFKHNMAVSATLCFQPDQVCISSSNI